MTPSERYAEREDTAHLYEQRLDRESRFREPSEAEIDAELERRKHNAFVDELASDVEFEPLRQFILRLKE